VDLNELKAKVIKYQKDCEDILKSRPEPEGCFGNQCIGSSNAYGKVLELLEKAEIKNSTVLKRITYIAPEYLEKPHTPDNAIDVIDFVGETPACTICGGTGEYEGEYGPLGCQPCNSRLLTFIDYRGKEQHVDWGQSIELRYNGMHLVTEESEVK